MPVAALTFVGVVALIFGAYWFAVGEPETREQQSLKRRLKSEDPDLVRANATVRLLKQEQALSGIDLFNVILGSFGGALVGGLLIGVVESLGGLFLGESLGQIGIFAVFIGVLLFRPQGLFGAKA